ncbi:MAG: transketolase family protein [Anaerolineae bacterium]
MAIASRWLAARYNRPGFAVFDFDVYALAGDGDMMEGVASEAASVAGHLGLSNLCWVYDSNRITIEGATDLAFSEDAAARFRAYGWRVVSVGDANNLPLLRQAFGEFKATPDRPTLILVRSHIAYGSPHKQDSAAAHGSPLGEEEVRLTKRAYGWPEEAKFLVPDGVREHFAAGLGARGSGLRDEWLARFDEYRRAHPALARDLDLMQRGELPVGWDAELPQFEADSVGIATRSSAGRGLNAIAARVPWLIGGAADLAPSTKTYLAFDGAGDLERASPGGRNIHFGVREHAMAAIVNGLALCHLRPFGATFFVFSDYARPALRLSAMMELPTVAVFTHDSISLGEDGPTHQPVEHLANLRAIPGMVTMRPADANEAVEAWRTIMGFRRRPAALILSRQKLPTLDRSSLGAASGLAQGAYVLLDPEGEPRPDVILIASGSEVALCLDAAAALARDGIGARVVSMPSWELFEDQDQAYRDQVLPPEVWARVAVEEGSPMGWERYIGPRGAILGMTTFGASAPMADLAAKFGFTVEHVVATTKGVLGR